MSESAPSFILPVSLGTLISAAVKAPVLELNVKLAFVLGCKSPVALVPNKGKQVVSVASFTVAIAVAVPPPGDAHVRPPALPDCFCKYCPSDPELLIFKLSSSTILLDITVLNATLQNQ